MSRQSRRPGVRLNFEPLEKRENPATWVAENFDSTALGVIPGNWSQWSSASNAFGVANVNATSGTKQLRSNAASNVTSRAWANATTAADADVSANVYTDSLVPTEIFARGQNLSGSSPTFYAASITRGVNVQLIKSVGGTRTILGTLNSSTYVSYQWVKLTLRTTGTQIRAEVRNLATGQYLNSTGGWQSQQTNALTVTDSSIPSAGKVGVNRPAVYSGAVGLDDFNAGGNVTVPPDSLPIPPNTPSYSQNFNTISVNSLPPNWQKFVDAGGDVSVKSGLALSPYNGLNAIAPANKTARAWLNTPFGPDLELTTAMYLDSLNTSQAFIRGSALNTGAPTFYAVQLTRGLTLQLTKTVNGVTTTLAGGSSTAYFSYQWARVTLRAEGNRVRVRVQRADNGQYLASDGSWTTQVSWFRDVTDSSISGPGFAGVGRAGQYTGGVTFDDFNVGAITASTDTTDPVVTITSPTTATISGTVNVTAQASDNVGVTRVEFWLDNQLQATRTLAPYSWSFVTTNVGNGSHSLSVRAFDAAGNVGIANQTLNVQNNGGPVEPPGGPTFPRHYQHIRIAQLAYFGTPITSFEQGLLQNSVDLVIPNAGFLSQINSIAPNTPQMIYGNLSNLYQDLLVDWLNYADGNGINRETAFYHVAQATTFSGGSPSSQPVNWLWRVARNTTNLTGESRTGTTGDVSLGTTAGDVVYFGYLEKFRELNFAITTPASGGWSATFEYASAVNSAGQPTNWSPLNTVSNTTNGFTQSGRVSFDPPTNWKKSLASGTTPLYFVRLRVVTNGAAPVAATVLGRDYVNANGSTSGTMPAFDASADDNDDGYLNDAEYAQRASGKNARFHYESRLFYPAYGQMRFATNPAPQAVRTWAGDMLDRTFDAYPLADGIFVDNSNGKSPATGITLVESAANYSAEYGQLLAVAGDAISPRWILGNTTGGGTYTDQAVENTPGSMEEFALRPLDSSWSRFLDVAGLVNNRLDSPNAPYLVLDSHPQGGSQTDTRTQLATLAYYYLVGDPVRTFLMFYGGVEPSTSWTRHWSPAAAYDIGQPEGGWSEFATGNDPANTALLYKVYKRDYSNALVLYKPLSYKVAVGTGTIANGTATTHQLGGSYRPLRADGTLGTAVTSVVLRNGEGAILIPV